MNVYRTKALLLRVLADFVTLAKNWWRVDRIRVLPSRRRTGDASKPPRDPGGSD